MTLHWVPAQPVFGFTLSPLLQTHNASLLSRNLLRRRGYVPRNLSSTPTHLIPTTRPSKPKRYPSNIISPSPYSPTKNPSTISRPPPPQAQALSPPPPRPTPTRTAPLRKITRHYAIPALTLFLALDFLLSNVFQLMTVTGPSMYPFLNTDSRTTSATTTVGHDSHDKNLKDTVFVSLWNPTRGLRRGHVIAFHSPLRPEILAVKRVVAVAGDVVQMRPGATVASAVGGSEEGRGRFGGEGGEFAGEGRREGENAVVVPPGHLWVEGEHPEGNRWSVDSNTYGPVAVGLVVGRVEAVVWPWSRRGWVRWQDWGGSGGRVKRAVKREEVKIFRLE